MMPLSNTSPAFKTRYASHLKHLKLQGLRTKTGAPLSRPTACRLFGACSSTAAARSPSELVSQRFQIAVSPN